MLLTIFIVVLILWILGFTFHIASGTIHLLMAFALVVLIFNLMAGRRHAAR